MLVLVTGRLSMGLLARAQIGSFGGTSRARNGLWAARRLLLKTKEGRGWRLVTLFGEDSLWLAVVASAMYNPFDPVSHGNGAVIPRTGRIRAGAMPAVFVRGAPARPLALTEGIVGAFMGFFVVR
jgi:hypothetical protein